MAILLSAYSLLPLDSAFTTETVLGFVGGIAGRAAGQGETTGRDRGDHAQGDADAHALLPARFPSLCSLTPPLPSLTSTPTPSTFM
ncbi:hypothetical protein [Streptomyces sp. NPDC051000]|uniref:hypothetical protein n=1 Tax=Streptomyces sp. NPDC051000 TaxID=3155520 RepID=UPI00340635A9